VTWAAPTTDVPVSTYRLQIRPEFGFDRAAEQVGYLRRLGITHLFLSPILQAVPGSEHGYDVVDHTRLSEDAGGRAAFDRLVRAANAEGVALVADVVPNHMAAPVPERLNERLWALLRDGQGSPAARWFDVDWDVSGGRIVLPVLGSTPAECVAAGELTVGVDEEGEPVLRYYDHAFPLQPGTQTLPMTDLLDRQPYQLAFWRDADALLNFRRFFDISTLIAIRVEDDEVFADSHRLLAELVADGSLAGLRIDHPDGLADPGGYLTKLAHATNGTWTVVEKILEGDEELPADWDCAGTTGYDLLARLQGLFIEPEGADRLLALYAGLTGDQRTAAEVVEEAKKNAAERVLVPEISRLVRVAGRFCPEADPDDLRRAIVALLVGMDRYRVYATGGGASAEADSVLASAGQHAAELLGTDAAAGLLDLLVQLAAGRPPDGMEQDAADAAEFATRFAQTCGPVMAKGVEDTAFYRWCPLAGLNEVGGDPGRPSVSPRELDHFARRIAANWPHTMTTLSTHDTKRSEDVRARLAVLTEYPDEWAELVNRFRSAGAEHLSSALDVTTEYLLWQTIVGTWPISADRLEAYALKAVREAKTHTTWTESDTEYEGAVVRFVRGVVGDPEVRRLVAEWLETTHHAVRAVTLGQKLLQLVLPGVPDVYQGTELVDLSLVDPDNRRAVDFADRDRRLHRLDAGERPADLSDEKLLVTSAALRLRAEQPGWFVGAESGYRMLDCESPSLVAVGRGPGDEITVVALVSRHAGILERTDGFGRATVAVPPGEWVDALTGRVVASDGHVRIALLLDDLPVALLVRNEVGQATTGDGETESAA
jgi:(1->4)-alpha-D-glucan 1-alpha-D-glucosylmutase